MGCCGAECAEGEAALMAALQADRIHSKLSSAPLNNMVVHIHLAHFWYLVCFFQITIRLNKTLGPPNNQMTALQALDQQFGLGLEPPINIDSRSVYV